MKKKPKTLGRFLTRKYVTTSLLLIALLMILITIAQFFMNSTNDLAKNLGADTIVRPDYEKIDITILNDVGGWVEILDENNRVIYTKGKVMEKKEHYTQNQLLTMDGLQAIMNHRVHQIGPLSLTIGNVDDSYLATFAPFTAENGKEYICIAKLPRNRLWGNFNMTFTSFNSPTGKRTLRGILLLLIPSFLIFIFCIWRYSKSVKEHLVAPNEVLMDGLRAINHGDYEKKIHLNAEYEYIEIEDSFNHMAEQLKQSEQQRLAYEKERQLLFANMAHDLRTPITTIKGTAKAVADGLISEEKLEQTMETIISKTDHMNELVTRLLIFSKLESPDYQLHLQELDVSELVREVLLEQLEIAEENEIDLMFDLPEEPLELAGDAVELRRVFDNLISNSIHHNPAGTIVHIRLYTENSRIIFEVTDNGNRIPKDLQEQLFVPFVSGDDSRSTKGGSGLGLAISKKIVEKHGGTIAFIELTDKEKMFQVRL
ncbi:ATP-binding protein [Enterococcus sp. AZ196]|uniref:sensor histidine kinase n=1 Tax=Enterococcus sp. AZ196 TaxID=2774659 RepID=UPI003D2B0ADE